MNQKLFPLTLRVASSFALAALMTGCVTSAQPMPKPEVRAAAMKAAEETFATASAFTPRSESEKAVTNLMAKFAEASGRADALEPFLAGGFEHRFSIQPGKVSITKRPEFLASQKGPFNHGLSLQSVSVHPDGKMASATALSTRRYKHFSPRYLETFGLEKVGDQWKITQYVQVPVHPAKAELYDVKLIVTSKVASESKELERLVKENPDTVVDEWISKAATNNGKGDYTVFAIFRESPPVGTTVELNTDLVPGTGTVRYIPIRERVAVEVPYYVLTGYFGFAKPWYEGMTNAVVVNGTTVAQNRF